MEHQLNFKYIFFLCCIVNNTNIYHFQIWDTAGQERFRSIISSYYRDSHGIVLVYDLTQPSTARSILNWLEEIDQHAIKGIPIILVGNKSDLETLQDIDHSDKIQETREIIADISIQRSELMTCECSAKKDKNIESIFLRLTDSMLRDNRTIHIRDNEENKSIFRLFQRNGDGKNKQLNDNGNCC